MTKSEKSAAIEQLTEKFSNVEYFYVTDASALTVEQVNNLRALCFEKGVEMKVVKNTLAIKALEAIGDAKGYDDESLKDAFKGPTAILFTEVANAPARLIKDFRKDHEKPILKAAYIDTAVYVGDDQVDALSKLKSKEELLGDILGLLQSPMQTVLGGLQSGGNNIMGLLKALEEREG